MSDLEHPACMKVLHDCALVKSQLIINCGQIEKTRMLAVQLKTFCTKQNVHSAKIQMSILQKSSWKLDYMQGFKVAVRD